MPTDVYTLTVTNSISCQTVITVDFSPIIAAPTLSLIQTNPTCEGDSDGGIDMKLVFSKIKFIQSLDSFTFEINGLNTMGDLVLNSITANGVHTVSSTYNPATQITSALIEGDMFLASNLANPDDNQFNSNEIMTLEVCYTVNECQFLQILTITEHKIQVNLV